MARTATVFELLVASPSDLSEERTVIRDSIQLWNVLHGRDRSCVLEAVMWESHATPEFGDRPQAIVNRQLVDRCDALLGTFWTRIGSPTGEALSGTVEEIERIAAAKKPVMLYFSSRPLDPAQIDVVQLDALRAFKKQCRARGYCEEYASPAELADKLALGLTRLVGQLLSRQGAESAETSVHRDLSVEIRRMRKHWQLLAQSRSRVQEARDVMRRFSQLYLRSVGSLGSQEPLWEVLAHLANAVVERRVSLDPGSREWFSEVGEAVLAEAKSLAEEGSASLELDEGQVNVLKTIYLARARGGRASTDEIGAALQKSDAETAAVLETCEKQELIQAQTYFNGPVDYDLRGRGLVLLNMQSRVADLAAGV